MARTWNQRLRYARTFSKEKGIRTLVTTFRNQFVWGFLDGIPFKLMFHKFRRLARNARTVEQSVDMVWKFEYCGASIAPFQVRREITGLLDIVKELKPKTVLEIGTAKGGTLFLFTRAASEAALLVSLDLPGGAFGGGYDAQMLPLMRLFALKKQRIEFVRSDSHATETKKKVQDILGDAAVDFLFIDGDHTYEGVKKDFEMYSPLVRKGGVIAFHDVCEGDPYYVGGVPRFWKEVSVSRNSKTFIKDPDQGGFGIGVLFT